MFPNFLISSLICISNIHCKFLQNVCWSNVVHIFTWVDNRVSLPAVSVVIFVILSLRKYFRGWIRLTHWPLGHLAVILKAQFLISLTHPVIPQGLCFCTSSYATWQQTFVHMICSEQLFRFLSFLTGLLALTYSQPGYNLVDFYHDHDLDFWRSNMEFAIFQPKMARLLHNEKQTYQLNSMPQMWVWFDLGHDLDIEFSRSNMGFAISYDKMIWLQWNKNERKDWTLGFKCGHQCKKFCCFLHWPSHQQSWRPSH